MANSFGANFTVDVSDLKTKLREANTAIRETESSFRASAAQVDSWSDSASKVQERIDSLNTIIGYQQDKVKALKDNYEKLVSEGLDETSEKASKLRTQINKEEEALNKNTTEVEKNKDQLKKLATQEDKTEDQTKDLTKQTTKATEGWSVMRGVMSDLVTQGINKAIDAFKGLASTAIESYQEYQSGYENIVKATGATGEVADNLQESYKSVSKRVKGEMTNIGKTLGEVNTRFGVTGKTLEDITVDFIKFAEVNNTDAAESVRLVSRAMQKANIDTADYNTVLDALTKASQANGVEANKVAEALTKYGVTTKALGFTTNDTIAILSNFEKEGVNTEQALKGLETATKNWTSKGKDARTEFENVVDDIKKAPTDIAAGEIAIKAFGKNGRELADAFRSSKFEYSEFVKELDSSQGTVKATYEQITDSFDEIELAWQGFKTDIANDTKELVDGVKDEVKAGLALLPVALRGAVQSIENAFNTIKVAASACWTAIEKGADALWTGLTKVGDVLKGYTSLFFRTDLEDNAASTGVKSMLDFLAKGDMLSGGNMYTQYNALPKAAKDFLEIASPGYGKYVYDQYAKSLNTATLSSSNNINSHYDYQEQQKQKARDAGLGVTINQTNYYSKEKSRYELYQSEQSILSSVKVGLAAR